MEPGNASSCLGSEISDACCYGSLWWRDPATAASVAPEAVMAYLSKLSCLKDCFERTRRMLGRWVSTLSDKNIR